MTLTQESTFKAYESLAVVGMCSMAIQRGPGTGGGVWYVQTTIPYVASL